MVLSWVLHPSGNNGLILSFPLKWWPSFTYLGVIPKWCDLFCSIHISMSPILHPILSIFVKVHSHFVRHPNSSQIWDNPTSYDIQSFCLDEFMLIWNCAFHSGFISDLCFPLVFQDWFLVRSSFGGFLTRVLKWFFQSGIVHGFTWSWLVQILHHSCKQLCFEWFGLSRSLKWHN